MSTQLKLFTNSNVLDRTYRTLLTRFLQDYQASLSPDAAALLASSAKNHDFEEFCVAWATQFKSIRQFGAPLIEALYAIEFLAMPENASILDDAISHLPPGYDINRNMSTLHQSLSLWVFAQNTPGITWPVSLNGKHDSSSNGNGVIATDVVPAPTLPTNNGGG